MYCDKELEVSMSHLLIRKVMPYANAKEYQHWSVTITRTLLIDLVAEKVTSKIWWCWHTAEASVIFLRLVVALICIQDFFVLCNTCWYLLAVQLFQKFCSDRSSSCYSLLSKTFICALICWCLLALQLFQNLFCNCSMY